MDEYGKRTFRIWLITDSEEAFAEMRSDLEKQGLLILTGMMLEVLLNYLGTKLFGWQRLFRSLRGRWIRLRETQRF